MPFSKGAANVEQGLAREKKQGEALPARLPDGRWPTGVSGNPRGALRKGERMADRLKAALAVASRTRPGATVGDDVIANLVRLARSDEPHAVRAIELILDRTDGKVAQPVEVSQVAIILTQDQYDAIP